MKIADKMTEIFNFEDLAGARLVIATKDLYPDAEKALKVLESLGSLKKKEGKCGTKMSTSGYAADHYLVTKTGFPNIKCEIQIRTMTQDLWSVFSHYESYKLYDSNEDSKTKKEELLNYARLMDVSDFYATSIRKKKIAEADNYHMREAKKCFLESGKPKFELEDILSVKKIEIYLKELGTKDEQNPELQIQKADVVGVCTFLRQVSGYGIFTLDQLKRVCENEVMVELLRSKLPEYSHGDSELLVIATERLRQFQKRLTAQMKVLKVEKVRTAINEYIDSLRQIQSGLSAKNSDEFDFAEMDVLEAMEILCSLHAEFPDEFDSNDPSSRLVKQLNSLLEYWSTDQKLSEMVNF